MIERPLRRVGAYLFAINQSAAKIVLDPIYETVAASMLRGDIPISEGLRNEKFPENLYFEYRARSRKLEYYIEDWDFSKARPELLTPRQRQMMHTVALGETSGSAVADGFLRSFRALPELAAFFGTWFVEELNHFLGYHLYLERMNERWPENRARAVAETEFRPYADDPYEVAACNMYQELIGFLVYRQFGKQVHDPFLAAMLKQFAKDELRHYKLYQQFVARRIQRDPGFRKTVLKVFLKATSPFNQVSGGPKQVIEHLERGIFYFRKTEFDFFMDQLEYLLGMRPEKMFRFYFSRNIAPCEQCSKEVIDCSCERLEPVDVPVPSASEGAFVPPPRDAANRGNDRTRELMDKISRLTLAPAQQ